MYRQNVAKSIKNTTPKNKKVMIVNENSRKEIIIVQKLSNGERFKMKFETGTTKSWAKSEFMRVFEAKNLKIRV